MTKFFKSIVVSLLFFLPSFAQTSQKTDAGLSLSAELNKDLNRYFSLTMEEEVRLISNTIGFDRNVTALGIDYVLFDRKIKVGAYYAFLYLYNSDYLFEPRHRSYFNVSYKETFDSFTLSWRGRFQGTYRDENRDDYKINPKYLLKNKFQLEYAVWGKPWKPFISCELYNDLNNPKGNYLTRMRYQAGTAWRLNRSDYFDFFLRYDQNLDSRDTQVFSIGIGYKVKL
ncbi:MAG: hypothetical protein EZS26_000161 [Candidatus Ordinivivax streblomastigis]|uniref:DUF2490 domain-containing protein n=1 Tax=Candidatus Ordinivivax streblomastigis TaxID=2540710 RepID=A0A5M8P5W2_9BACT|nr:MAG: hypothetical protein EZS26_000161 [Candidatus Ordinivivax streblomastigis]